ncbi:MAG TPA: MlaD family protein [Thermodesulfobacteriota bacterium]|nr:MlaD family protein [Thermodesulfobacteriota bacterium]
MRTEILVGIFFIVGLVILLAVFEFVGDIPFLTRQYKLRTYFQSVGQLREGNPVQLQGVKVGEVSEIKIADRRIEVVMRIDKGTPIKKDSVASVRLTSALGTSYVNITFGSPESPIAPPGSVLPSEEPTDINDLLAKVESAVSSIEATFGAFGESKEGVNKLLANMNEVFSGAAQGEGTLGKLLKDDSLYNEARGAIASINKITTSIQQGQGTLGKLVTDESLYNETRDTMADLGKLADRMTRAEGSFGKLLNDDTLYDQASEAATHMNSILKKVDQGQGTLGKLVHDDSLYYDAKNAVRKVDRGVETQEDLAPLSVIGTAFGVITLF